jgi:hypothetical protein
MKTYAETHALARTLQRLANNVDQGILVEVGHSKGRWVFHIMDRWGGDWYEESFQKVKDFLYGGY